VSYLVPFGILVAIRLRLEERMMLEAFGDRYATYMLKTDRLIPGVW
jgi:protein-S-isoprenylcysteine O-methyltransferase Ste14